MAAPVNGWGPVERDSSNGESAAGDGGPLTVSGVRFTKGLGVHAASEVRYQVPAGCTSFAATVGVDDEVATGGSVVFRVLVAGAQVFDSGIRTGSSPNVEVRAAVQEGAELRLVVSDAGDGNAFDHADWADAQLSCGTTPTPIPTPTGNQPPVPVTDRPVGTTTWKVGDELPYSGRATDPEDGELPGTSLIWNLVLRHCTGACHSHLLQTSPVRTGMSGSFTAPSHEYPSHLELQLTATDSAGASSSTSVRLDPQTVELTFRTNPGGLKLSALTAGTDYTDTPFMRTFIVGSQVGLGAPATQVYKSATYSFRSWSDGGALNHTVTAPAVATTYTATYRK